MGWLDKSIPFLLLKKSVKLSWSDAYLVVFPCEHLYPHDSKNEPENETDQKDVEDTWNSLHESIYYDLKGQKKEEKTLCEDQ